MSDAVDRSSPAAGVATGRDWQRSVTFFVVLGILVVPFLLLLLLVSDKWGPLAAADQGARDELHVFALGQPWFVAVMRTFSDSGSSLAWQIVTVVAAMVLLVRRRWRLAAFVVVTIAASSLLNSAVKATVNRDRPAVDQPFVNEPGASFPERPLTSRDRRLRRAAAAPASGAEPGVAACRRGVGGAHGGGDWVLPGGAGRPLRLRCPRRIRPGCGVAGVNDGDLPPVAAHQRGQNGYRGATHLTSIPAQRRLARVPVGPRQ